MSTNIVVDIAADIAVYSQSIVGQQSVDSWSIVGRWSVDSEIDFRPSIGRYFGNVPRLTIGHMSVIHRSTVGDIIISELSVVYRSTVGGISINCRSNISCVLIYQVSPMAFF